MTTPPLIHRRKRKTPLSPFLDRAIDLEAQGQTVSSIDSLLRKDGYAGTFSAVRTTVETIRRNRKRKDPSTLEHRISRKQLAYWVRLPYHRLSEKEKMDLEQCLKRYPAVRPSMKWFKNIGKAVDQRDYDRFLVWLRGQLWDSKNSHFILIRSACAAICRP
jgi:hypothetical protein